MRIVQSGVNLASTRVASTSDYTRTTTEAWIGQRRPSNALTTVSTGRGRDASAVAAGMPILTALPSRGPAAMPSISDQARQALQNMRSQLLAQAAASGSQVAGSGSQIAASSGDSSDPLANDPELKMLEYLIEALTGRKVKLLDPGAFRTDAAAAAQQAGQQAAAAQSDAQAARAQASPAGAPAGWGVDVQVEQVHQESETTGYAATGQVVTSDGRAIDLDFALVMHRDETEIARTEVQAGDAVRKVDPIAIKLGGGAVELSDVRTQFDINSDGKAENVALPGAGTYFLSLDRNGNGQVDDGSELFGPSSGNGFTELRALDEDGNGWIDEGDGAYGTLRLWSGPDAATSSLAEAGVGALYVGASTATQFEVKSASNGELGQVRSSSVYLSENGQAGAIAQVDLTA